MLQIVSYLLHFGYSGARRGACQRDDDLTAVFLAEDPRKKWRKNGGSADPFGGHWSKKVFLVGGYVSGFAFGVVHVRGATLFNDVN